MDAMTSTRDYDPKSPPLLRFCDRIASFLDGSDTPRAYLERCLAAIAEHEPAASKIRRQVAALHAGADDFITRTASGPAPPGLDFTGSRSFQICWTLTRAPSMTLPRLRAEGLPLGVQLMGFVDQDQRLARNAKWLAETR